MFRPFLLAPLVVALAGCAVGPAYHAPAAPLAGDFVNRAATSPEVAAAADWWRGFGDPDLLRVVALAQRQNLDLAQAAARVAQARAAARGAGADLAPRLDAQGASTKVRQSMLSPIGEIGSHLPGFARSYHDEALGVAASWEIDLFGGLRRGRQAAEAQASAAADQQAAVRNAVAAEAADAYLQVRGYEARLAAARAQLQVSQDLLTLVSDRLAQGLSSEREVNRTRGELEAVRATVAPLQAARGAQLYRLAVLVGVQPGALTLASGPIPQPPALPGDITPAQLLGRRPDIAAAERRLVAANAQIGVAEAEFFPKVTLSGLLGVDSLHQAALLTGDAQTSQFGAGLRWRLFDFGRVQAEVAAAKGRRAEALAAYQGAALTASAEVETALSAFAASADQRLALAQEVADLQKARDQAQDAYANGALGLIDVRDADSQLLTARDQLAQAETARARAAVQAFRAMGGGWLTSAPRERLAAR